jgi:hypothetical protein
MSGKSRIRSVANGDFAVETTLGMLVHQCSLACVKLEVAMFCVQTFCVQTTCSVQTTCVQTTRVQHCSSGHMCDPLISFLYFSTSHEESLGRCRGTLGP